MITYEGLCEKVGFDILTYEGEPITTEDDSQENPLSELTIEELDFLMDFLKENEKDVIFLFFKSLGRSDVQSQSKEIKQFQKNILEITLSYK